MAKTSTITARAPFKPATRAPQSRFQARGPAAGTRDVGAEARNCQRKLRALQGHARAMSRDAMGLRRVVFSRGDARRAYQSVPLLRYAVDRVIAGEASLNRAGLLGLGTGTAVMSPTMWGIAGVALGAAGMWLWMIR